MLDQWDHSVFWTGVEARLAINEALRDWNLLTGRWRTSLTLSTTAGGVEYLLSSMLLYGMRVTVSGTPLVITSTYELDYGRPSWRGETTASLGDVPTTPTLWAPQSLQQIVIWPATAGVGVSNLVIEGVANTPVLVEDADFVDLGEELIGILADYALHIVTFKQGGPIWQATLALQRAFLQAAAEENSLLKTSQFFRRYAGLDRRRDLKPSTGVPTQIDTLGQAPGGSA